MSSPMLALVEAWQNYDYGLLKLMENAKVTDVPHPFCSYQTNFRRRLYANVDSRQLVRGCVSFQPLAYAHQERHAGPAAEALRASAAANRCD